MRAEDLADAAYGDAGGDDDGKMGDEPKAGGDDMEAEVAAHVEKFAKALAAKDWTAAAQAFMGAQEACDYDPAK